MPLLSSLSPAVSWVPFVSLPFILVCVSPLHSATKSTQLCPLTVLFPFRVCVRLSVCLSVCPRELCKMDPGWLQTHSNAPASASPVLGLRCTAPCPFTRLFRMCFPADLSVRSLSVSWLTGATLTSALYLLPFFCASHLRYRVAWPYSSPSQLIPWNCLNLLSVRTVLV